MAWNTSGSTGIYGNPSQLNYQQSNEEQYNATLAGYRNQLAAQQNMAGIVKGGWENLYNQQAGFGASQQYALQNQYAQNMGNMQQSMAARGLGNTTILDAGMRGVNYDYAGAQMGLQDQLYQRQNQIRQGMLGWQHEAANQYTGLYGNMLGFQGAAQQARQAAEVQMRLAHEQQGANYSLQLLQGNQGMQQQQYGAQQSNLQQARQFAQQQQMAQNYGYY